MGQRATASNKAQVIRNGRSQSVRLPSAVRFKSDEVYIRRDEESGVVTLSEKPLKPSWEEIFRAFDEAIEAGETFEIERDHSLPREIDL
jgi:antitoxin VapB